MTGKITKLILAIVLLQLSQANDDVQIVTREEWKASPPKNYAKPLKFPITKVIVAHTVSQECKDTEACAIEVYDIQDYHMRSLNFGDIGYNFLIGGDGLVYEGRGWGLQGAHSLEHNKDSVCLAFIGDFQTKSPTKRQLQAAQLLLELGITANVLSPEYKLYGHRQVISTKSPGDTLYGIIKKWPHWSAL